jgi:tRNA nucleotidyltransferase (CCA-adding enzyme)
MEVCEELKSLSKEFNKVGHKLYIVGGFVRNHLLGLPSEDIDISSSLPLSELGKIVKKLKITSTNINPKLGTTLLNYNGKKFEYTCFRKESYGNPKKHTPEEVEFVEDIETDCRRRDFSINSIYYDIENDVIVDFVHGQRDLQKGIVRTTLRPQITLADDGLRILRAVRFASTLNFEIDKKTMKALKIYTPLLNNISKERILKEISMLAVADLKHDKHNHIFLKLCKKLELPKYIFNSTLTRMKKISKQDIKAFYSLDKMSRLIGFYFLVIKNYHIKFAQSSQLGYNINMILGSNGIKESLEKIHTTEKLFRIYQNLVYGEDILNASINYLTLSTSERNIIDAYLDKKSKQVLSDKISYAKDNNLPLSIHELDVCAQDLIENGIERKFISKILTTLYNQVLNMCVPNEKEALINLAKEINEMFNKIKESL